MPNQRRKDKRNITVTLDDELRKAIEKYAKVNGIDRTAAIKGMCRKILGMPGEKSAGASGKPAKPSRAKAKKRK